jgi:hypothetical protein
MRRLVSVLAVVALVAVVVEPGSAALVGRVLAFAIAITIAVPLIGRNVGMFPHEPVRSPFLPSRAKATETALPVTVTWMADEVERARTKTQHLSPSLVGRLRDVAVQRLLTKHRLNVAAPEHSERIRSMVSPVLAAVLEPGREHTEFSETPMIPAGHLPTLLSELEQL